MKKSAKKIILACCGALGGLCIAAVPFALQKTSAAEYAFEQLGEVRSDLKKGDTMSVPDGRFGDVEAAHYLYTPAGEVYTSDSVTLMQHGKYTIKYLAEISDKIYTEEVTFDVANPLTYFLSGGENSNVEYGYSDVTKRTGLKVQIENGATLVYNQVIDLNETSQNSPAVKLTFMPESSGFGAETVYLTLTDIYDPDNKVEVRLIHGSSQSDPFGSCHARAPGQYWAGRAYASSGKPIYVNNAIGAPFRSCPYDTALDGTYTDIFAKQSYSLWFDMSENKIWGTYTSLSTGSDASNAGWIIDFDDAAYQTVLWDGFTTGEVYLSISCDTYSQPTNGIQLLSVNGSDLTATEVSEAKTSIVVDTQGYGVENLPNGTVGYSYPVFEATAYDKNCGGTLPVNARVFYGYTKVSGTYENGLGGYIKEIPVIGGRFETPYTGYYGISYTATTYTGKTVERVVGVRVTEQTTELDEIVLGDCETTAEPYETVRLADVESYGGGVGKVNVTRKVTLGNEEISLQASNAKGYTFQPTAAGEYTVTYDATDMLGNSKTQSYTVSVSAQSAPVFTEKAALPRYFFEGVEYALPALSATNASGEAVAASIKIIDGNGERDYAQGSAATFKADDGGNAVIRYAAGGRTEEYVVPVLTVKRTVDEKTELALENYYITSGDTSVSMHNKGSKLSASGSGSVEFVRDLLTESLEVNLNMGSVGKTFDRFTITLTDSYDPTIAVQMSVVHIDGTLYLELNGTVVTEYKALPENEFTMTVKYDENEKHLKIDTDKLLYLTKTVHGDPFEGFTSGKAYIDFVFDDVRGNSYVYLNKIKNQFMYVTADTIIPGLYMDGVYDDMRKTIGDTFKVLTARADDVLGPSTKLAVSVTFNGKAVTSASGVVLQNVAMTNDSEYAFELTEYGDYIITYLATDWYGKTYKKEYTVKCLDKIAPTLTVEGMPDTIALGEVTLPKATATDNVTVAESIVIYAVVRTPSGKIVYVQDNKFKANEKGDYTVTYYAMDEIGNVATATYRYTV